MEFYSILLFVFFLTSVLAEQQSIEIEGNFLFCKVIPNAIIDLESSCELSHNTECQNALEELRLARLKENIFFMYKEYVFYSKNETIFQTKCEKVPKIFLLQRVNPCTNDLAVEFFLNDTKKLGFLCTNSKNLIIRETSIPIDCSNLRQIYKFKGFALVNKDKKFSLMASNSVSSLFNPLENVLSPLSCTEKINDWLNSNEWFPTSIRDLSYLSSPLVLLGSLFSLLKKLLVRRLILE